MKNNNNPIDSNTNIQAVPVPESSFIVFFNSVYPIKSTIALNCS